MRLEEEIKQKEFKSEHSKGIVNLFFTSNWLTGHYKVFFGKFELTQQQFNILRILRGQYPKAATVNLLKERMIDKMSDASRIVERLKIKGLVERSPASYDRRAVDVIITENGLNLLTTIDEEISKFEIELTNLNEEELKQLNHLLDKLRG